MNILASMDWDLWLLAVLMIVLCCFLMLVILLQRGRGGGLSAAFGGGGGSSAFGAKTGDVFTWITVGLALIFLVLNICSNYAFDQTAVPIEAAITSGPQGAIPVSGLPKPGETTKIPIKFGDDGSLQPLQPETLPPVSGGETKQPSTPDNSGGNN